jgi:DNA-binding NarL/FixJ family response regulator
VTEVALTDALGAREQLVHGPGDGPGEGEAHDEGDGLDDEEQAAHEQEEREKQVAELVCRRLTNRQIAAELVLSPETIRTHVRNTLRKFSLHSRRDLRHLLADHHFDTFPE